MAIKRDRPQTPRISCVRKHLDSSGVSESPPLTQYSSLEEQFVVEIPLSLDAETSENGRKYHHLERDPVSGNHLPTSHRGKRQRRNAMHFSANAVASVTDSSELLEQLLGLQIAN
jgi:hypothetical protein